MHLTSKREIEVLQSHVENPVEAMIPARFYLTLSEAALASIESGGKVLSQNADKDGMVAGEIRIDPNAPVVYLKVNWSDLGGRRGFAKLVIEAAGQQTVTQVFDGLGNIDEFLELSF